MSNAGLWQSAGRPDLRGCASAGLTRDGSGPVWCCCSGTWGPLTVLGRLRTQIVRCGRGSGEAGETEAVPRTGQAEAGEHTIAQCARPKTHRLEVQCGLQQVFGLDRGPAFKSSPEVRPACTGARRSGVRQSAALHGVICGVAEYCGPRGGDARGKRPRVSQHAGFTITMQGYEQQHALQVCTTPRGGATPAGMHGPC